MLLKQSIVRKCHDCDDIDTVSRLSSTWRCLYIRGISMREVGIIKEPTWQSYALEIVSLSTSLVRDQVRAE